MNISLNWAQEYSNVPLNEGGIDELVTKIGSQLGAVESVTNYGTRFEGVIVAKVVSCLPHPNAERLKVCWIDDGGAFEKLVVDDHRPVRVVDVFLRD